MYMARQLSFAGVTFDIKEVPLSEKFIQMYNASAILVSMQSLRSAVMFGEYAIIEVSSHVFITLIDLYETSVCFHFFSCSCILLFFPNWQNSKDHNRYWKFSCNKQYFFSFLSLVGTSERKICLGVDACSWSGKDWQEIVGSVLGSASGLKMLNTVVKFRQGNENMQFIFSLRNVYFFPSVFLNICVLLLKLKPSLLLLKRQLKMEKYVW